MTIKAELTIRPLQPGDRGAVVALDALLTGIAKEPYWKHVLDRFLGEEGHIGLAATVEGELDGYLFGEPRAFEFGSEECGWIFALGVRPDTTRKGVASALVAEARRRFRLLGMNRIRTMVRRTDVPFLSLFRGQGFVGGPFVQLELDIAGDANAEEKA